MKIAKDIVHECIQDYEADIEDGAWDRFEQNLVTKVNNLVQEGTTERQQLETMLTRLEIPFKIMEDEVKGIKDKAFEVIRIQRPITFDEHEAIEFLLSFEGYSGFYTDFHFDVDGNLIKIGIWE